MRITHHFLSGQAAYCTEAKLDTFSVNCLGCTEENMCSPCIEHAAEWARIYNDEYARLWSEYGGMLAIS